jgi:hypothetical protein
MAFYKILNGSFYLIYLLSFTKSSTAFIRVEANFFEIVCKEFQKKQKKGAQLFFSAFIRGGTTFLGDKR